MKTVLVVDDDIGILEVITIILEEAGYSVDKVSDSNSLFKYINKKIPDLILLDVWMPGVEGPNMSRFLKEKKETKHIPIIIISALSGVDDIYKKALANDFLSKPFEMDDLLQMVKKYIGPPSH